MTNDEAMMMAVLAVGAAYFLTKPKTATAAPVAGGATEIFVAGNTNGWRYFSDGTAISPDGTYYKNGVMVWNSTM